MSKMAVVTGGTRGLGRSLALALGERGYDIVAIYGTDLGSAVALEQTLAERGMNGTCIRRDLSTINSIELPVSSAPEEVVFVHNAAAAFQPKPLHLLSPEEMGDQWAVAARGFLLCVQALLRTTSRGTKSTVVAVCTRALTEVPIGFGGYLAAKAALAALTRSVAAEYGSRGVRAFCISPGFMQTTLTEQWHPTLREAAARAGSSSPDAVARSIMGLIEDPSLPAAGESYDV